jgi:FkbM family methyltransferase
MLPAQQKALTPGDSPEWRNRLVLAIGRRRWLKRTLLPWLGSTAYLQVIRSLRVYLDAHDLRGPSFYLMKGGPAAFYHYEEHEKALILAQLPERPVFLDVGANIGLFSLFLSRYFEQGRFFAFEPHPRLAGCVRRSAEANCLAIEVVEAAVSDTDGKIDLFLNAQDSGGHSTLSESAGGSKAVSVAAVTLDSFVEKQGLARVDFVKIDVQDAEAAVLRGARRMLEKHRPMMMVELNLEQAEKAPPELPQDYRFRPVDGGGDWFPLTELPGHAARVRATGRIQENYLFSADESSARPDLSG